MKLNHFGQTVRLAILGLGSRGIGQMNTLLEMKDVDVTAVCDAYRDRAEQAAEIVLRERGHRPFVTTDHDEAIDRADVDAVIIMTSWETHIPLAIKAMRCGKRPAMEVGGAASVEECWRLVRASEETGIPVMDILCRDRATAAQNQLSSHARRENLHGAFGMVKNADSILQELPVGDLLLVDDIYTSGSTIEEAARTLRPLAGERKVRFLTLALKTAGGGEV